MLSALEFGEHRFFHSDPFSHMDMDAEIAELRTMTRVTKLRQQIECRQEGAWMMVRDVPDDRSKNGTRKVTSYGRTTRSVTRSFTSSDVNFDFLGDSRDPDTQKEAIVEFPEEQETPSKPHSVEITEVIENDPKTDSDSLSHDPPTSVKCNPTKKTSVVTLGQGNVVLIDPQDSNFKVTGLSKDSTDEDVTSQKPLGEKLDKKVKKVGFSKTEVHFAPDSGKVNIVETDEKPPSSQVLRRKKKQRREGPPKSSLPKLYFGDSDKEKFANNKLSSEVVPPEKFPDTDNSVHFPHNFPVIREPSPLLSTIITHQAQSRRLVDVDSGNYGVPKRTTQSAAYSKKVEESELPGSAEYSDKIASTWVNDSKSKLPYLGNVSPKLSKLISNDFQHEFQLKQMEILKRTKEPERKEETRHPSPISGADLRSTEESLPIAVNIQVTTDKDTKIVTEQPVKIVTKVQVSVQDNSESAPQPRTRGVVSEPIYVNNTATRGVTRAIKVTREVETSPKPRASSTKITADEKDRKRTRTPSKPVQVRKTPTPKLREPKREVAVVKPMKPCAKNTVTRSGEPCRRLQVRTEASLESVTRLPKSKDSSESTKAKKSKEPLRSFEKVSNGWVGHCIVPLKSVKTGSKVCVSTTSTSSVGSLTHSSAITGMKKDKESSARSAATSVKVEKEFSARSALSAQKQFSLSREHLRSAKLVKELSRPDVPRPRSVAVRPRTVDGPKRNLVSRRRLVFEEQQGAQCGRNNAHIRRDSEQSDDSVVRADEEVRAYMFNSKNKVQSGYWSVGDG